MATYNGSNKIGKIYYGSNAIGKVYDGNNLVYESTPTIKYRFSGSQSTFPAHGFKIRQTSTYGSTVVYDIASVTGSLTLNVYPYVSAGNVCYLYNSSGAYTYDVVINGTTVATLAKQTSTQAEDGGYYDLSAIPDGAVFTYKLTQHQFIITY